MKKNKRLSTVVIALITGLLLLSPALSRAGQNKTILFHLKTGLAHDDAQICVAYNMIWAALEDGLKVNVLIDADAVNTFKVGWLGHDAIEGYPLPERLRRSLAEQFSVPLKDVPETYGRFLNMLHKKGAEFYINTAFLVLAKIETEMGSVKNVSAKFFKPVTIPEMMKLREGADSYMVY